MMKTIWKRLSLVFIAVFVCIVLAGCTTSTKSKTISFADVGWDSILFHNAVAGTIAESVFGYKWTEVSGSTPIIYEAVKKGEVDVHMEMWTDNLPNYKTDLKNNAFKELGINFDDTEQGFYVPRYVIEGDSARSIKAIAPNLRSVSDLKDYAHLFKDPQDSSKGVIYGGITGWEITKVMHKKYFYYALNEDYNYLEPGTDAATSAVLVSAYDKGLPVVAYYWNPTWLLGKYDFVLLEDDEYNEKDFLEGKCAAPSIKVTVCASNGFFDKNPDFSSFLAKYKTSSALTSEALAYIKDTGSDYKTAAKWFLKKHPELVESWLTKEQAKKLYDAIG